MTVCRVKGFHFFTDRHGKRRCYHRATGTPIDHVANPVGTAAFVAEVARVGALQKAQVGSKAGTLGKLIAEYRAHPAFLDLAPQTRADYQKVFSYLQAIDDTPLTWFNRARVVRIRDKAAARGRRFANYVKAVLSIIFGWGAERGFIKENAAAGIRDLRRKKGSPEANRPWSDTERHAALAGAPAHMRPALALMMYTGLGPKDALTLPRAYFKAGEIATRRAKTGEPVFWPAPAELVRALADAPAHDAITLCATMAGRPWTLSGFRASWRKVRVRLEADGEIGSGLTLYGLRHTVAVILREIGHDERTIADALGQKTIEMARHYAKGADLRPKMRGVVTSLDAELRKRRGPST